MSVNIKQLDGSLKKIAGNTVILDATASEIREGVITASQIGTVEGEGYKTLEIQLSPAMPDTKYFVVFNGSTNSNFSVVAQRPETGKFYCTFRNTVSTSVTADMDCHWYAVRLVELEGYTELQNKVNNPDSTPTDNSTNLVTSGGVYDAIKNASSVFIGTSSEWESETSKTDYQVAILTDKPNVNAVDSTTGDIEVVANKHLVFKGTLEEWEALTTAEKKTYDEALITNDMDTGEVVNGVTDGDMRAVTSNAVYDALNVSSTASVHCPSGSNTTSGGGANEVGTYTIPNDGVYAIHWTCYIVNETVGGTSMGTRVIQNSNTIAEQSFFQDAQAWNNGIFVSSVFKAKKNDVIKVYTISANPISWLESDAYIVRII